MNICVEEVLEKSVMGLLRALGPCLILSLVGKLDRQQQVRQIGKSVEMS